MPPKSLAQITEVNARMVMPPAAFQKSEYSQFYKLVRVGNVDDLPFSTGVEMTPARPFWAWTVLLVRADSEGDVKPPQVLGRAEETPLAVHQGCKIVNVVASATTGQTHASWCNVGSLTYGDPRKLDPREFSDPDADPTYFSPGSPFRP